MMAEVVPPGICAMPKVSGSRMATPFAPPRPGSTPMMTPRITPASISTTFFTESAIWNPCSSDWISSMARLEEGAQCVGDRPQRRDHPFGAVALGQRDLEPELEDHEEKKAVAEADEGNLPPRILAELPHEVRDEERRSFVQAYIADQRHVD